MTAEDLLSLITQVTFTVADAHRRLRLMREYFEKKFYAGAGDLAMEEFLSTREVLQTDKDALFGLGDEFYATFTKDSCYKLLDSLNEEVKKMPTVRLNVSFDLPSPEVAKLGLWFRQNLPVTVLLDIKIDADAFGGCTFAWNGYLKDFSLRYFLKKQKSDIVKIIQSYASKTIQ